ncbi:PD-(D/E)XK motif protein [Pseudomonas fluorescens]|uniref:PD-(D/E)XK motif protein n=1 Tax=Pseudomonas fluorescens TaxID=294 RepID=A0A5E7FZ04_PSEFL|nr:PD-(D/E)XK motif protein [Pseudomonas fluorescens]VVO42183.1 hypothetical protein PS710_06004 [Pseudomonas fluorescens]
MSNKIVSPSAQWQTLRFGKKESSNFETPTLPSGTNTGFGVVRYALSVTKGARVLIPLSGANQSLHDLSSEFLEVKLSRLYLDGVFEYYADITCTSQKLERVFSDVIIELLNRINSGEGSLEALRGTLNDFRMLFAASANKSPSREIVCGLVAELVLLDKLLLISSDAWKTWRGPLSERHDFRAGAIAIEVKSTKRIGNKIISISSIDQLLPPKNGKLYLHHIILEEVTGGDLCISYLTRKILKKTSSKLEVLRRLSAIGCSDHESSLWNHLTFQLEEANYYIVDDAFPKILETSFKNSTTPIGVSKIKYDVDLAIANTSKLDESVESFFLKEFIQCLQSE